MPPWSVEYWPLGLLAALLAVSAVTDVRAGRIYNWATYPAIAAALVGHSLTGGIVGDGGLRLGLAGAMAGLAVGFLPMLAAWMLGGVGGGDAKLMAAVGALAGWKFAIMAMLYGFAVAGLMAIIVMLHKRVALQTLKRVGRFLLLLLTPSRPGSPAITESPKIPFGLALCVGCGLALAEFVWRGQTIGFWPGM